jgi:hypothetical protein
MTIEEQILRLEKDKFDLEVVRDKKTTFRFYTGTVLLAFLTFGGSYWLDERQNKRAITYSEKQMVIPMIYRIPANETAERINIIDELLSSGFTTGTNDFLQLAKINTVRQAKELAQIALDLEIQIKAKKDAEESSKLLAADEKQRKEELDLQAKAALDAINALVVKQEAIKSFSIERERPVSKNGARMMIQ